MKLLFSATILFSLAGCAARSPVPPGDYEPRGRAWSEMVRTEQERAEISAEVELQELDNFRTPPTNRNAYD